ncbi:metallophosphoesterase [Bacillus sp. FJAT-45350]|uniref:metallophosphoesterase n=1 Tax=Bacillus sp. FJAT-45350 TaxID=2011014 RepID=UPI000BB997B9|nr:metallophosphoesterase [Bacillus sp. FJAT-45350]
MLIYGILFLLVYGVLVLYIGWSGWGWVKSRVESEISWRIKLLYIISLTIVSLSFVLGRLFENVILHLIGTFWMALFYLLVIILPLMHLSVWILRYTPLPKYHLEKWPKIITLGLILSLVTFGVFNAYSPRVQSYDIQIEKNTLATEQLSIVMASDMHFGLLSGKNHAKRMVNSINALAPDIVVFPGDIVDDEIDHFMNQGIDNILAQINAPYGVYVSLGNHDRHNGPIEELINTLERGELKVLYDEVITVNDDIILIGRRDFSDSERKELATLTEGIDSSKPVILLEHQPYDLDIAQQQGIDLVLSGHTHLGQVFPGNLITSQIYKNNWGLLKVDQLHSIVSSGYGFWGPPIRIGSRSELVQIDVSIGL